MSAQQRCEIISMNETKLNRLHRQILRVGVDMGDSEENLDFIMFQK